jgi:hypothetical protein
VEVETVELILTAVAGPASGVAVALLCLSGFGWFLVKHLLPQQEKALDKVLADSAADRKLFERSITTVTRRLDKIEDDLSAIRLKV